MNYKYFTDENIPSLEQVLDNREKRVRKIEFLENKYPENPILCFKLNIPGKQKINESILKIFNIGVDDIKTEFSQDEILFEKKEKLLTGPELYMVIFQNPLDLKRKMTYLEENSYFGRLYDIDLTYKSKSISRKMINLGPRRCFLCDNEAKLCSRSRNHSLDEMLRWIENLIDNYERKS